MKITALLLAALLWSVHAPALALEDGLYRDQAPGYGGNVIVTVKVRNGQMTEITTDNTGGDKSEYYLKAEEALIPAILQRQGLDGVDAVAGATGTSQSIFEAMRGILEQANYTGAPLGMINNAAEEAVDGAKDMADGVMDDAKDAEDDVMDGAENIAEGVKDGAENAVDATKNAADQAVDSVENAVGN